MSAKVYGKIDYEGGKWKLELEPHVTLRLKRVFPRINHAQHGEIWIQDTIETARDLEWFTQRFPLEFASKMVERMLREGAEQHRDQETVVAKLLAGVRESRKFELALPPREYQATGASLLMELGGLLLADDLGLGKTVTAICPLADPRFRPALVVCPTHLTQQWQDQIAKFLPQLTTHILSKGTPYDITAPKGKRSSPKQLMLTSELPDVVISNYHKIHGWAETLARFTRYVIFDEVQELRNGADTKKGSAAYHLARNAALRTGLSHTPIHNYGDEIYRVLEPLRPGSLGEFSEFKREWVGWGGGIKDPTAFGTYLRDAGLMLRRTRKEVARELPKYTRIPHQVEYDAAALDAVEDEITGLAELLVSSEAQPKGAKFRAAEEMSWKLRQATGVAKAPYVAEFVKMLVETDEQVVLFGWHHKCYDVWLERLARYSPALFTGKETAKQKIAAKEAFVSGKSRVLIISLRSGSGLDGLQHVCCTTVHGELDWAWAVHEQCDGRVHRDGQTRPVMAYYLMTDSGSDPIVAEVLGLKRGQLEGIRDPNADPIAQAQTDGNNIRRLAEAYLQKKGKKASA